MSFTIQKLDHNSLRTSVIMTSYDLSYIKCPWVNLIDETYICPLNVISTFVVTIADNGHFGFNFIM